MKKTVITVIAVCLAAVLLCSAACLGTIEYVHRSTASAAAESSLAAAQPAEAAVYTPTLLASRSGGETLSAAEIYELACRQVVGISTTVSGYNIFGQMSANAVSGTGFIISGDGYILTNNHVVKDAKSSGADITVKLWDGSEYKAALVGTEGRDSDVAVLKIEAEGLTPVTLGSSADMKVGEQIYVVGNPLGELTYTMTSGIISALDREIATEKNVSIDMFQLDAAVNSGNSGGPVYDAQGRVIGIVTAKYQSTGVEGLGFAIPIDDAAEIARQLIENGRVTGKAWLGITVTELSESEAQRYNSAAGVYITDVGAGSCAENAGLLQGDVIVGLGGKDVSTITELNAAKRAYKAGDSCEIKVWRSGKYLTLTVVFDEQPEDTETAASAGGGNTLPGSDRQAPDGGEGSGDSFDDWMRDYFGGDSDFGDFGDFEDWMNEYFGGSGGLFGGEAPNEDDDGGDNGRGSFWHFGN